MKKLLTILVPLAMLVAFSTVSLAADDKQELNQDLNQDLNDDVNRDSGATLNESTVDDDGNVFDDVELNNTTSRESNPLASKRGRQPRRGQTASTLSDVQKYWGDHNSGKSTDEGGDEDPDEDEDPDVTPTN